MAELIKTKNNKHVLLRKFSLNDLDLLTDYLQKLGVATKKRFGPHPFDKQSISDLYKNQEMYQGYVGIDVETQEIVAYSIIKFGYIEYDLKRLQSYGIALDHSTDCTLAPSVADEWQSCGIGNQMFHFIHSNLQEKGMKRIILWGGVQADNEKAINFYKRNNFETVGQFTHNGENYDMVLSCVSSNNY